MTQPVDTQSVKLSVTVFPDVHKRMSAAFPWGTQSAILRTLIEASLEFIEKNPDSALNALMRQDIMLVKKAR